MKKKNSTRSYLEIIFEFTSFVFYATCCDVWTRHANSEIRHIDSHQLQSLGKNNYSISLIFNYTNEIREYGCEIPQKCPCKVGRYLAWLSIP